MCSRSAAQDKPLREVLSTLPLCFLLFSEAKPSHTITKPCSSVIKFRLKKAIEHAPQTPAHWQGEKAFCTETAANWLLRLMTSRPLTPEFENNNLCGGNGKGVKEQMLMLQAEPPGERVTHAETVYVSHIFLSTLQVLLLLRFKIR